MKVFPMLKKNALYITLAVLVVLFVYYVYMNKYYEHATTYTSPRVCALFNNLTTDKVPIRVEVYALDSDRATSPNYTAKKVYTTSVAGGKNKTLKFTSGNYGFIVNVSSTSTGGSDFSLVNLSAQKKSSKKDMWGRKRTTYQCGNVVTASPAISNSATALTIKNTKGENITSSLNVKYNASSASFDTSNNTITNYSVIYENATNSI